MTNFKRYPYSLIENGNLLEHAKGVLAWSNDPQADVKIRKINAIFAKERPFNPNIVWLTGPELNFVKKIIKVTCWERR